MSYEVEKYVKAKREDYDNTCVEFDAEMFRQDRCASDLGKAVAESFNEEKNPSGVESESPATRAGQASDWQPVFSPWRHGGWYVDNLQYPSGAVGCVSRNYPDKKWRIVCDPRPFETRPTFKNRIEAARAERKLTEVSANA